MTMATKITAIGEQAARQRVFRDYYALLAAKAAFVQFASGATNALLKQFNKDNTKAAVDAASVAEFSVQSRIDWVDMYEGKGDDVTEKTEFGVWAELPAPTQDVMTYTQLANMNQGRMAKQAWFRFITRVRKVPDWMLVRYGLQLYRALQRIGMDKDRVAATRALCTEALTEDDKWTKPLLHCYQCPAFNHWCTRTWLNDPGTAAWETFISTNGLCPRGLWVASAAVPQTTIYAAFDKIAPAVANMTGYIYTALAGDLSALLLSIQAVDVKVNEMCADAYGRQPMIERTWGA